MNFDLTVYQQQAKDYLRTKGRGLKQSIVNTAPYAVYGTLLAASLWPMVMAAQGGALLPVMMTMGGIAANVGGNLIANQIQKWIDDADADAEVKAAHWLAEQAATKPELVQAGDLFLKTTDAVEQVRAEMDEGDQNWFNTKLAQEMQQLGNYAAFASQLSGSAIARGENAAAAASGGIIIGSDSEGNITTKAGKKAGGALADGKGATATAGGGVIIRGSNKGDINTGN